MRPNFKFMAHELRHRAISKFEIRIPNLKIFPPQSPILNPQSLLSFFLVLNLGLQSPASAQEPKDANIQPRAPKAEFVNPPSPEAVAANSPSPTPTVLPPAPPKSGDVLASSSAKARADLDAALKELAATREKIAGEKVPLSQALTKAEDDLAIARKQLETAQRTRDMRNLDQSSLKAEIKQREDENTYMLNLLNEFSRNFGEKGLHISERKTHR